MDQDQIFATVFELLRNDELTNEDLCVYLDASPAEVRSYIQILKQSGINIVEDFNFDDSYRLVADEVMEKRFLRFEDFLNLRTMDYSNRKLSSKTSYVRFANLLNDAQVEIPYDDLGLEYLPENQRLGYEIATAFVAKMKHKIIHLNYVDVAGAKTVRDIEPMEIFYRDESWYIWAYCHLRSALRIFKITKEISMEETAETFIPRPFNIIEGTNDPRNFNERYFVTLEFEKSVRKQVRTDFRRDKLVELPDRILVLEKDLYNPDYAKKFLSKYGKKVAVSYP
ncbi:helix-turn-helix transcriptional regulator [Companilactobacillus ginsenosidimutans]|uniref:WYL domain-containing protein n=1 Tax=Companilactobacillus ginsenosidimutans TaxID=1007676 RepID=A0A0H4QHE3_9LACO|nr:WYL domain-containing protein [Companilactobacillus ginsenosidimutans]AKP67377.1 hypothetical protein ABM34_07385 [Companilactobacillus ginsenosidimutans]